MEIVELFKKLRNQELSADSPVEEGDLNLLDELIKALKDRDDFVLGSFVYHTADGNGGYSSKFWPKNQNGGSIFLQKNPDTTYETKAIETFKALNKAQLFISSLIYEENERRTKCIELIHSNNCQCDTKSDAAPGFAQWFYKTELNDLEGLFQGNEKKKKAKQYAKTVAGYFPDPNAQYVLVYCPFLVPDEKPPGNFFGVFKHKKQCPEILEFLTLIQLAGTLIFSRMAVDAKMDKVKQEVEKLRPLHDSVMSLGNILSNIERVMNPNYLSAGRSELYKIQYLVIEFFMDINNHDVNAWTNQTCGNFIGLIRSQATQFNELKKAIQPGVYDQCFGAVQALLDGAKTCCDDARNAGYIMKSLFKEGRCPLRWIISTENYNKAIELKKKIGAMPFVLAFNALNPHNPKIVLVTNNDRTTLKISITVKADKHGEDGLKSLLQEAKRKITEDTIQLHDGHTSTVLALLARGASNSTLASVSPDSGELSIDFEFKVGVIK